MANPEHLEKLKSGTTAWNAWRSESPHIRIDLRDANLAKMSLGGMHLSDADLRNANLEEADLTEALLYRALLENAILRRTNLSKANLTHANLYEANLSEATLAGTILRDANLEKSYVRRAILPNAFLAYSRLTDADLSNAVLQDADLSRAQLTGANLTGAVLAWGKLTGANLAKCNLTGANLKAARIDRANLQEAVLSQAQLSDSNFSFGNLARADITEADLTRATIREADLTEVNLRNANLQGADLTGSDLSKSILIQADFRSANLQQVTLHDVTAADVKLWETQRAGWSIRGILCECAYWDEEGRVPTYYAPGEFERLYSDQTCIELFYQGGVSTFELNTLPALLQHLASIHADSNIRLKSIEETGGGARISISVGDADTETAEKIKADAMRVYQAQLVLREKETERLQIEKSYLESLFLGRLIPAMLSAGTPQNVFNAPVTGLVLASGDARVDFHQTVNDNSALIALLERMIDHRADLNLSAPEETRLEAEVRSAKSELQKPNPDKSVLAKSVQLIQKLATEALMRTADKLGEQVISGDWSTWLHELGRFVAHLG